LGELGEERSGHGTTGSERWLLTYADMITLLMVFFIVLYAMAELDKAKYAAVSEAFRRIIGGGNMIVPTAGVGDGVSLPRAGGEALDPLEGIGRELYSSFAHDGRFSVRIGPRGLVISLAGSAAFDSGAADLKQQYLPLMSAVAERLRTIPNDVSVEGFTDSDPIATPAFPSNWYLSVARANQVRNYLAEHGVDDERLIVVGYGDTRSVWSNASAEGKARNRRVDVVILRDKQVIDLGEEITAGE
jgi:chemotaxis protein MotB